jgi:hypothetical protein
MGFGKLEELSLGVGIAARSWNIDIPTDIAIEVEIAGSLHFEGERHVAINEGIAPYRPVPGEVFGLDGICRGCEQTSCPRSGHCGKNCLL